MENQKQTDFNETELITALRDEYEKKLEQQRAELETKHAEEIKKQEQKHIEQMKALLLGKEHQVAKPKEEKTYEQTLYDNVMKNLKF